MDVMAQFGLKLEDDDKKAKRPKEHKTDAKAPTAKTAASSDTTNGKAKRQNKKAEPEENQE
jgi:hypothetical protein